MPRRNIFALHLKRLALVGLLALLAPLVFQAPAAYAMDTLVVDNSSDNNLSACTAAPNDCTLRGAINHANANIDTLAPYTITFNPSIALIALLHPLPTITIAGTTIMGNSGLPRLDGIFMSPAGDGLTIAANNVQIRFLTIVNIDPGTANQYADIRVASGKGNLIANNYLGTLPPSPAVTNCTPNPGGGSAVSRNAAYGVFVAPNSTGGAGPNNGVAYITGNYIGCHTLNGVHVLGADYVSIGETPSGDIGTNFIGGYSSVRLPNGSDGIFLKANGVDGVRNSVIRGNIIGYNSGNGILLAGVGVNDSTSTGANRIYDNAIGVNALDGIALVSGATTNTIGGVVSAEFNTIYLNGGNGLRLDGSSANEVIGNHIGTDDTATYSVGNITGILLTHGAANNLVHDNIIRFNSDLGVHITGAGSDSNQVYANTIRNQGNTGVQIDGGARFNRIGSPAGGPTMLGNLISGNAREGIYIAGSDTSQNLVYGNKIGTTANGAGDDGNGLNGVVITNDAHHNQVGRSIAERNLISGNGQSGVRIDLGAHDNSVGANYIGLNAAGTAAIPNSAAGVAVIGANRNGIGSSLVNATQFISGNTREGIYVESAANTMIGQTNQIGVAGNATAPLGNGMQGVMLVDATSTWVAARTIANNGGAGVAVTGASASDNKLMPLAIYGNAGLPVDLGNDGPTANDSGDADSGPNTLLNYPQVTSVSGATISGSACPGCQVYMYTAIGNPAAPGGGGALLDISPPTADASGGWSATLPAGTQLAQLTLVACQAPCFFTGNTSELRPRPQMFVPVVRR